MTPAAAHSPARQAQSPRGRYSEAHRAICADKRTCCDTSVSQQVLFLCPRLKGESLISCNRIEHSVSEPEGRDLVHINKAAPVLRAVNVELRNDIFSVKYLMRRNREFAPCNVSSAASAAAVRNPGVS